MLALYELWNDRHKWHPRLNERLWNNTLKKMVFSWDKSRRKRSRKWINKGLKKAKIKIQWYYSLMKVKREWSVGTWSCHLGGIIVVVGNIGIWKKIISFCSAFLHKSCLKQCNFDPYVWIVNGIVLTLFSMLVEGEVIKELRHRIEFGMYWKKCRWVSEHVLRL